MRLTPLQNGLAWLVALLVPVVLVMSIIRLLLTPAFLRFEYSLPNFPPDTFGFTQPERIYWSRFAVDYLLNSSDISYLADLHFQNGQPIYNERELSHMVDVKVTVQAALRVWISGWWDAYLVGLRRGSWLTLFALATIILLVLLSFNMLFVAFHNVFFKPGTWTFLYSDTLIRLFPERLWRDIFMYVGGISVAISLIVILVLRGKTSRG